MLQNLDTKGRLYSILAPHLPVWHTELVDPRPPLSDEHSSCRETDMELQSTNTYDLLAAQKCCSAHYIL